jgi:cytochrome c oxidase subunit 4
MAKALTEFPVHETTAVRYFLVYLALIALTWVTYGVTRYELGPFNLPVVLAIAIAKGTLVAIFFMHVLHDKGVSRLSLPIAIFFIVLLILIVLGDVGLRFPLAVASDKVQPIPGPLPTWTDEPGVRMPAAP